MPYSRVSRVFAVLAAIAVAGTCALAMADAIAVPNYSFESPDVSGSPYYSCFANSQPSVGDWGCSPQGGGALRNNGNYSDVLTNAVGNQVAFLEANGEISQDLAARYEVGKSYKLTMAVAGRSDAPGTGTDQMEMRLFWRALDGSTYGVIGSTTITRSELSTTTMKEYSVTIPAVQPNDPSVGNTIGIWLVGTQAAGRVCWSLDDVRIVSIPEPTTCILLCTGLVGLLAYAWRKRR